MEAREGEGREVEASKMEARAGWRAGWLAGGLAGWLAGWLAGSALFRALFKILVWTRSGLNLCIQRHLIILNSNLRYQFRYPHWAWSVHGLGHRGFRVTPSLYLFRLHNFKTVHCLFVVDHVTSSRHPFYSDVDVSVLAGIFCSTKFDSTHVVEHMRSI